MLAGKSMGVNMKVLGVGDAAKKAVDFITSAGYEIECSAVQPISESGEYIIGSSQLDESLMILLVISGLENDEVSKLVVDIGDTNHKEDLLTIFIHVESYFEADEKKLVQARLDMVIPSITATLIIKNEQLPCFKREGVPYTHDGLVNEAYFQAVVGVTSPAINVGYIGVDFNDIVELYSPRGHSQKGTVCLFGFGRAVGEGRAASAMNQAINMLGIDLSNLSGSAGVQVVMLADENSFSMGEYADYMDILYDNLDENIDLFCALNLFEEQREELCSYLVVRQS